MALTLVKGVIRAIIVRYKLSPNYAPSPLPLKAGGHVPQLLWELAHANNLAARSGHEWL